MYVCIYNEAVRVSIIWEYAKNFKSNLVIVVVLVLESKGLYCVFRQSAAERIFVRLILREAFFREYTVWIAFAVIITFVVNLYYIVRYYICGQFLWHKFWGLYYICGQLLHLWVQQPLAFTKLALSSVFTPINICCGVQTNLRTVK